MHRFVFIWLPIWSIESRRKTSQTISETTKPFALFEEQRGRKILSAVNRKAQESNLYVGQSLSEARACEPELQSEKASPGRDVQKLRKLALCVERYGSYFGIDGCDGVWVDIQGVDHLFEGETNLLSDIAHRFVSIGLTVQIAVAGTYGAAWALARYKPHIATCVTERLIDYKRPITSSNLRLELAELPVAALRINANASQDLDRMGLKVIGDIAATPRKLLQSRFSSKTMGQQVLLQLDRCLGDISETPKPLRAKAHHHSREVYDFPIIEAPQVESAIERLTVGVCQNLERSCKGVTEVELTIFRSNNTFVQIKANLSRPSRTKEHIRSILLERLERRCIDLGCGVDAMLLVVRRSQLMGTQQKSVNLNDDASSEQFHEFIDNVQARIGTSNLYYLRAEQSHTPERAQVRVPVGLNMNDMEREQTRRTELSSPEFQSYVRLRPSFLLSPPEPIDVIAMVPYGAPKLIKWRRQNHPIAKCSKLERLEPNWWSSVVSPEQGATIAERRIASRVRDYFHVETEEGQQFWVFRSGSYVSCNEFMNQDSAIEEPSTNGNLKSRGNNQTGSSSAIKPTPKWYIHGIFT